MAVTATNSQRGIKVPLGALRRAAESALSSLGLKEAELSLLVTGDRKMRRLNRDWRGIDRTTDVLSFSALPEGTGHGEALERVKGATDGPPLFLGDVVISAPKAMAQAQERGHSLEEEMLFLLVHGILHLLGYDHEGSVAERRKMERRQRELMAAISMAPLPSSGPRGATKPRTRAGGGG